ncbi:hypothetical protein B0O99DRAFT_641601 [Bisporella sp. PMI_857]|nr:hypothetical protein B0O99DRAFT_641601 [Bisporella sp. PMI_857]
MPNTRDQVALCRKRKHAATDFTPDQPSEPKPSKRYKLHSTEFYNSLSKVWLTRRALRELDRRTSQINRPQPAAVPRRGCQENSLKHIKRFC